MSSVKLLTWFYVYFIEAIMKSLNILITAWFCCANITLAMNSSWRIDEDHPDESIFKSGNGCNRLCMRKNITSDSFEEIFISKTYREEQVYDININLNPRSRSIDLNKTLNEPNFKHFLGSNIILKTAEGLDDFKLFSVLYGNGLIDDFVVDTIVKQFGIADFRKN